MKLHIITIVLDGMPFITKHLDIFYATGLDFHWHIIEGAANNYGSTKWCKSQPARLSRDGTTEYLNSIVGDSRVTLYRRQFWKGGKDEMVNMPLIKLKEQSVLMQVDVDEMWIPEKLIKIVELFKSNLLLDQMSFQCNYYVSPDIVITAKSELQHNPHPWIRAWRFQPGMKFQTHEPPVLMQHPRRTLSQHETYRLGLVFDHYAYVIESQVAYKEKFYGYDGAVECWRRLQANTIWPARVKDFLPWSNPHSIAQKIKV